MFSRQSLRRAAWRKAMDSVKRKLKAAFWEQARTKDLICNLSVEQLNFLFSDRLYSNIFLYDLDGMDITPADMNSVPWYVAFYLSWPHRRHRNISAAKSLPSPSALSRACANFTNRVHWQWAFRNPPTNPNILRLKHRFDTPPLQ